MQPLLAIPPASPAAVGRAIISGDMARNTPIPLSARPFDGLLLGIVAVSLAVLVATLPTRVPRFDPTDIATLASLAFGALVWFVVPSVTSVRVLRVAAAVIVGLAALAALAGASIPTALGAQPSLLAVLGDIGQQVGRTGFQILLFPCGVAGAIVVVLLGPILGDKGFLAIALLALGVLCAAIVARARRRPFGWRARVVALLSVLIGLAAIAAYAAFLAGDAHFGPVASEFETTWFAGGLVVGDVLAAAGWLFAARRG